MINIIIIHKNDKELHDRLDHIGFERLYWATNDTDNKAYTVVGSFYKNEKCVYYTHGNIRPEMIGANCLLCTNEDEFIEYAKQLFDNKEVIITK